VADESPTDAQAKAAAIARLVAPGLQVPRRPARLEYSAPSIDGDAGSGQAAAATTDEGQPALMYEGTPRNAKCPCGSGKTYKRCHGDPRNVA
jgi:preprotein translocase subunit SecA